MTAEPDRTAKGRLRNPPLARRKRPAAVIAAAAGLVALAYALGVAVFSRDPLSMVDTLVLLRGTENQATCLAQGHLVACRELFEGQLIGMDWFPIFQHLPDAVFHALGLSFTARRDALGYVSLASLAATVAVGTVTIRRAGHRRLGALFALVAVTGPLLVYAHSTFGEMLAALLILSAAAATQRPERAWVIGLAAFAASITKETAAPIVFVIGVLGLDIARVRRPVGIRRAGLALIAGTAGGLLVDMLYNVFRFGTVENPVYAYFNARGPSPEQILVFLGGLFVAPNAGIAWFWPSALLVLVLGAAAPFVASRAGGRATPDGPAGRSGGTGHAGHAGHAGRTGRADAGRTGGGLASRIERALDDTRRARWHAAGALAVFLALNASLATWWAPYGWFGWGPRLTVPWVPALVLLALLGAGGPVEVLLDRLLATPRRVSAAGLALGATALPHLGVALRVRTVPEFFASYRANPAGADYYRIVDRYAFTKFPVLLSALRGLLSPAGLILAAALLWASVRLLRAAAPRAPGHHRSGAPAPPGSDSFPPGSDSYPPAPAPATAADGT